MLNRPFLESAAVPAKIFAVMPRRGVMPPEQAGKPVPVPAGAAVYFVDRPELARPGLAPMNPRRSGGFSGRSPELGRK